MNQQFWRSHQHSLKAIPNTTALFLTSGFYLLAFELTTANSGPRPV
ncbi:MAG: hypothetical protein WA883_00310 [Phormidesmis sp.]